MTVTVVCFASAHGTRPLISVQKTNLLGSAVNEDPFFSFIFLDYFPSQQESDVIRRFLLVIIFEMGTLLFYVHYYCTLPSNQSFKIS